MNAEPKPIRIGNPRAGERGGRKQLPPPVVPADVYTEDYYRKRCLGHDKWEHTDGREAHPIYGALLDRAGMQAGDCVLDIGTGRGELPRVAVDRGAVRAVGIDYSEAAISMAIDAASAAGYDGRVEYCCSDSRAAPVDDESFDLAMLLEVVEHLSPAELDATLAEALRALRPGASIFIHTAPCSLIYSVSYRALRLAWPPRLRSWPKEPRSELELLMHVNEQRIGRLRRTLRRAGFGQVHVEPGRWVHTDHLPDRGSRALFRRVARVPAVRRLVICDMFARGFKATSV